jgi:hypothetical protein
LRLDNNVRLRFTRSALSDLARHYRLEAERIRRDAESTATSTVSVSYVERAKQAIVRAEKLEKMAKLSDEFILMPAAPFEGGPPSLLIVGGTDVNDGSAFVEKKSRRG